MAFAFVVVGCSGSASEERPGADEWADAQPLAVTPGECGVTDDGVEVSALRAGDGVDVYVEAVVVNSEHLCARHLTSATTEKILLSGCPDDRPVFSLGCFSARLSIADSPDVSTVEIWKRRASETALVRAVDVQ